MSPYDLQLRPPALRAPQSRPATVDGQCRGNGRSTGDPKQRETAVEPSRPSVRVGTERLVARLREPMIGLRAQQLRMRLHERALGSTRPSRSEVGQGARKAEAGVWTQRLERPHV